MTHTTNPQATRTIQRKAAQKKADRAIADAARKAAMAFAGGTLGSQDLAELFATVQRADAKLR